MKLIFRIHAIQRMFERSITKIDVRNALANGETIENYPDDTPYPSHLLLGWSNNRSLHVVVADNIAENEQIVITVYEPNPNLWNADFRRRK